VFAKRLAWGIATGKNVLANVVVRFGCRLGQAFGFAGLLLKWRASINRRGLPAFFRRKLFNAMAYRLRTRKPRVIGCALGHRQILMVFW
jgi:hypothetical protein